MTLLSLALAAQHAHARLAAAADGGLSEEGQFLVSEVQRRLETLVTEIRQREEKLDHLSDALADRMNNLLMAIKTASDLLRSPSEEAGTQVREQLEATVETGRQAVKRLREVITDLR